MTREEKFSRDISKMVRCLSSIAEDLHYFREKDEAAAAVKEKEEPKYTCKDCTEYELVRIEEPNEMAHWCALHCCTISEEGLSEPCAEFVKDGEF